MIDELMGTLAASAATAAQPARATGDNPQDGGPAQAVAAIEER
jgi:hypothetical protein